MSPFTKLFIYAVIVADILAITIFGGRYILDGTILSEHKKPHIVVAGAEEATQTAGAAPAEAAPPFDYAAYVADAAKGEKVAGKCKACHTFGNGEPNRVGPNLWAIVNAPVGHAAGFAYSDANTSYKSTHPTWSEDALFSFLENPRSTMPGTKMQFNGVKDPKERADLIAWLKTLK